MEKEIHKIKIIKGYQGKAEKIFIDDLELKGVCGYKIQNSESVNNEVDNKMILTIEFAKTQLLEIISN